MVLAFILAVLLDKNLVITPELWGLLIGSFILMLVGIRDDIRELHWKNQLFAQLAVAIFIFITGVRILYITNPISGGVFHLAEGIGVLLAGVMVIFWIVLVINATNWIDGVDGLSGGITSIAAAAIFILSLRPEVNQPPVAILAIILLGVSLGFLVFNFFPSRVLAGTSGSMFMGLVLSALAIFSGTKVATAFLVLSIPILDLAWVVGERIKKGQSIFQADKNHLHYKLMDMGWSQRKIAGVYYVVTILIAAVALNTRAFGKGLALLLVAAIMFLAYTFIRRKINDGKK